jgi:hypothetical protein
MTRSLDEGILLIHLRKTHLLSLSLLFVVDRSDSLDTHSTLCKRRRVWSWTSCTCESSRLAPRHRAQGVMQRTPTNSKHTSYWRIRLLLMVKVYTCKNYRRIQACDELYKADITLFNLMSCEGALRRSASRNPRMKQIVVAGQHMLNAARRSASETRQIDWRGRPRVHHRYFLTRHRAERQDQTIDY